MSHRALHLPSSQEPREYRDFHQTSLTMPTYRNLTHRENWPNGLTAKMHWCGGSAWAGGLQKHPALDCEKPKLQSDKREHDDADWRRPDLDWRNRQSRHDTAVDSNCGVRRHGTNAGGCTHGYGKEHKEYYDPHGACRKVASADFIVAQVSTSLSP